MKCRLAGLNYIALAVALASTSILAACADSPTYTLNTDALSATDAAGNASAQLQTSPASWQVPRDDEPSNQTLLNTTPASDPTHSNSSEINADDIVAAYEQVIGAVHNNVLPSVVSVFVLNRVKISDAFPGLNSPFGFGQRTPQGGESESQFYYRNGQGSGFVWDDQGHIVTNRHVVVDAERVTVVFSDGSGAVAEIIGMDEDSDLAVLKVERDADLLRPVTLGDSNEVLVGQLAITIGNPFGQDFSTTTGIVSAIGRTLRTGDSHFSLPKVIQTDAPMNPGNSGGPLLNRKGHVIGIDAQIITRSGANTGIGFAIPVNMAKQVVPSLIAEGTFTYSWLGIRGTTLRAEVTELMGAPEGTRGAQVIALADGGPAQAAGLLGSSKSEQTDEGTIRYGGDVITSIEGQPVDGMNDLIIYLIENTRPDETVTLGVVHDGGETSEIAVTLQARPESLN